MVLHYDLDVIASSASSPDRYRSEKRNHDDRLRAEPNASRGCHARRNLSSLPVRFRPIMMTPMAAILGALPLMVGTGTGSELRSHSASPLSRTGLIRC